MFLLTPLFSSVASPCLTHSSEQKHDIGILCMTCNTKPDKNFRSLRILCKISSHRTSEYLADMLKGRSVSLSLSLFISFFLDLSVALPLCPTRGSLSVYQSLSCSFHVSPHLRKSGRHGRGGQLEQTPDPLCSSYLYCQYLLSGSGEDTGRPNCFD